MKDRALPADDTIAAVDRLAVGGYASFGGHLAAACDPRPAVRWDRLVDGDMRTAMDEPFVRRFGVFEPRAVRSIWMKWYLNAFLPPFLLADLLLARTFAVALDDIAFIIADDARVAAVRIDQPVLDTSAADLHARFETLIFHHFAPLIDLWSAHSEVTRRVYWSNVGNTFEAMLRRVESVSGRSARFDGAQRLIETPVWRDGRANPLHGAVHYVENDGVVERRRRVCCLQYLLPDRRFCSACPIDEAHAPVPQPIAE